MSDHSVLPPIAPATYRDLSHTDPIPADFVRIKDFGAPAAGYLGYAARMGYVPGVKVRRQSSDRNGPVYVDRKSALRYLRRVHPQLFGPGRAAGVSPLFQAETGDSRPPLAVVAWLRRVWNRLIGRARP